MGSSLLSVRSQNATVMLFVRLQKLQMMVRSQKLPLPVTKSFLDLE